MRREITVGREAALDLALAWSKRENAELRVRLAQKDLEDADRSWNQLRARALAGRPGAELVSISPIEGFLFIEEPPSKDEVKDDILDTEEEKKDQ